jgi:hypothetical protein
MPEIDVPQSAISDIDVTEDAAETGDFAVVDAEGNAVENEDTNEVEEAHEEHEYAVDNEDEKEVA